MENTAYLLDPETAIFRAVELPGAIGFKPICDLLGCRLAQMVRFDSRMAIFRWRRTAGWVNSLHDL